MNLSSEIIDDTDHEIEIIVYIWIHNADQIKTKTATRSEKKLVNCGMTYASFYS